MCLLLPQDDNTLVLSSDLTMEISMEKPRWVMVGNGMVSQNTGRHVYEYTV